MLREKLEAQLAVAEKTRRQTELEYIERLENLGIDWISEYDEDGKLRIIVTKNKPAPKPDKDEDFFETD